MLFMAIQQSIQQSAPEILLSTSSAFGWRGYRIDKYNNLADSQYYFQIDYGNSHILLFQECYRIDFQYFYPFRLEINLKDVRFFYLNQQEQVAFLRNFIKYALAEGALWQNSDYRKSVVHVEFLLGKETSSNTKDSAQNFGQVSEKYLFVAPMQESIFSMLGNSIDRMTQVVLSRTNTKEFNTHWRNWSFRGYKMKINEPNGAEPAGRFKYVWRIYFDNPTFICFELYDGRDTHTLYPPLHMNDEFLNLPENEQQNAIDGFVKKSLESLLTKFNS
jgi:hypothetical protein